MIERDVRWLVGQCLMVGLPGPELDYESSALLARHLINNVVLFRHNTPDLATTRRLTDELQSFARVETGVPMLIAADQEEARVQRLVEGATRLPSAMLMGRAGPGHVRAVAEVAGRELLAAGVNMVLAPVADVNNNPLNPVIGVRSLARTRSRWRPASPPPSRATTRPGSSAAPSTSPATATPRPTPTC